MNTYISDYTYICVCVCVYHFAVYQTHNIVNQLNFNKKNKNLKRKIRYKPDFQEANAGNTIFMWKERLENGLCLFLLNK